MDAPPSAPVSTDNIERVSSGGMAANADKAFVFGGTMKAGVGAGSGAPGGARPAQAVDVAVSVSGVEATPGDVAGSGGGLRLFVHVCAVQRWGLQCLSLACLHQVSSWLHLHSALHSGLLGVLVTQGWVGNPCLPLLCFTSRQPLYAQGLLST